MAYFNNQRFELEPDLPAVGCYLYVYNYHGVCLYDYPQDTEEMAKDFACEEFDVPLEAWTKSNTQP
ncbi:hypothetical protein [Hymenobacter jeollabukensis]|uniref:Uncharacterized protein n=1 Tax=Hymenobacter jeollabukensis TaxID=2025313 RepID=A0A5R8WI13_9BACT|nr:hypothetical protein [Hymenobacter jeollabukensis]TLM87345.1 hypothetical protein FDY95_25990 [Hymenobacter jeollabukensis]